MGNSFKYLFNAIENNSHKYQFVDELILNKSINSNLLFCVECLSVTSTFSNFHDQLIIWADQKFQDITYAAVANSAACNDIFKLIREKDFISSKLMP